MKKSKKKAARKLSFVVPIYNCKIFVVNGSKEERLVEEHLCLQKDCLSDHRETSKACAVEIEGEDTQIICIFENKIERAVLMHECVHITMCIFKKFRIPISYKNQECFAYTAEYVYLEVCKKLKIKP